MAERLLRRSGAFHDVRSPPISAPIPMRKLLTGEPVAGKLHTGFGGRGRRQPFPTPVAPLECDVLQLATTLDLQHYRLSSSHRLKQRPDLLNGFDCLLVYLVNDVPREQVRCVSVQAWRPRNYDDSRRIPPTGEGAAEPIIQVDHENSEAIDHVSRIDEIGQVIAFVLTLHGWNHHRDFLPA